MGFNWETCAVIGACGKMGSGIALLMLKEMARNAAEKQGRVREASFRLYLIDHEEERLYQLRRIFRPLLRRYAEKKINFLREAFREREELVSNEEVIEEFVEGAVDNLRFSKRAEDAALANWVFEAIVEDVEVKASLYQTLSQSCSEDALFFSNTSSIPIRVLQEKGGLQGRILGLHFYNPPVVQKLVEVIAAPDTNPALLEAAEEIAQKLGKVIVRSRDVAGFIGNGHFIREIGFACSLVDKLSSDVGSEEAIVKVDAATRDRLLRPMGVFQLIDYVGIEVCLSIARVMSDYLADESFRFNFLEEMVEKGIKGGQDPDGSQKEGFFQYEKGRPAAVYSIEREEYVPIRVEPAPGLTWKALLKDPEQKEKVKKHEEILFEEPGEENELAKTFLIHSREAADLLVSRGVADSKEDVHQVLRNGFYHLLV